MGDFFLHDTAFNTPYVDIITTATSTANVKTSYVSGENKLKVTASGIRIFITAAGSGTALIDLAYESTASPIIDNIFFQNINSNAGRRVSVYDFPIAIPAGGSFFLRHQISNTVSNNQRIFLLPYSHGFHAHSFGAVDTYGVSTATSSATSVSSSSSPSSWTFGSWVLVGSAISYPLKGIIVNAQRTSNVVQQAIHLVQIAIGTASSPSYTIIPAITVGGSGSIAGGSDARTIDGNCGPYLINIPSGRFFWARVASNFSTSPSIGISIYGLR